MGSKNPFNILKMKFLKTILLATALLAVMASTGQAQRVSLTQTAETVNQLQIRTQAQEMQLNEIEQRLNNIQTDVDTIIQTGKNVVKIPTTVEEAQNLYIYASSIIMFILVGIFKDRLPKWITPFTFSMVVAIVISAIGYFAGEFSLNEIVVFLMAIGGGSNILHQIKKPAKIPGTLVVNPNVFTPPIVPQPRG